MSYYYKVDEVKDIISTRVGWFPVLKHFADELEPALRRPTRHVYCPVHVGDNGDAFRLFKDSHETGGGVCNTCGIYSDGFELLMWIRGWSFEKCLREVGDYVGAPQHEIRSKPSGEFVPTKRDTPRNESSKGDEPKPERQFRGKGVVLDYGLAPYEFKRSSNMSFYITLRNKEGKERNVWGVDLERASSDSQMGKGDLVSLFYLGRTLVTVVEPIVDEDGVVTGERTIRTHRNEWEVVINKKAENPEAKMIETVNVANGAPEVIEVPERTAETQAVSAKRQEPRKVIPISDTPEWVFQMQERMKEQAAGRARQGKQAASNIVEIWGQCVPLSSSAAVPAFAYFQKRGFAAAFQRIAQDDDLRFHPSLPYYQKDKDQKVVKVGEFPAIVASIRDLEGNILTLHRIYLTAKGDKAKVGAPKKMMAVPDDVVISGCAIQLGEPTEGILGVSEGLETALAVFRATGLTTWATVSAQMMTTVQVPEHVHTLLVWADLDRTRTGEKAAAALKERLSSDGVRVIVITPQCSIPKRAKGVDWNDVLRDQGILGFPNPRRLRQFLHFDVTRSPLREAFG